MEKKIKIVSESGIHAGPAARLVQEAMKYQSEISIVFGGEEVSLRSILGILSLGLTKGTEIILRAEGEDAELALEELEKIFFYQLK